MLIETVAHVGIAYSGTVNVKPAVQEYFNRSSAEVDAKSS